MFLNIFHFHLSLSRPDRRTRQPEDAAAIRRELVDAQVAAPLLSHSMPLVAANTNWVTVVAGINADYLVAREWQVVSGRAFTGDEIASAAKVAIVNFL
jgi:putative ABC transport system permease protein